MLATGVDRDHPPGGVPTDANTLKDAPVGAVLCIPLIALVRRPLRDGAVAAQIQAVVGHLDKSKEKDMSKNEIRVEIESDTCKIMMKI
jgi:hypothetical protein